MQFIQTVFEKHYYVYSKCRTSNKTLFKRLIYDFIFGVFVLYNLLHTRSTMFYQMKI